MVSPVAGSGLPHSSAEGAGYVGGGLATAVFRGGALLPEAVVFTKVNAGLRFPAVQSPWADADRRSAPRSQIACGPGKGEPVRCRRLRGRSEDWRRSPVGEGLDAGENNQFSLADRQPRRVSPAWSRSRALFPRRELTERKADRKAAFPAPSVLQSRQPAGTEGATGPPPAVVGERRPPKSAAVGIFHGPGLGTSIPNNCRRNAMAGDHRLQARLPASWPEAIRTCFPSFSRENLARLIRPRNCPRGGFGRAYQRLASRDGDRSQKKR